MIKKLLVVIGLGAILAGPTHAEDFAGRLRFSAPAEEVPNPAHAVAFPINGRRGTLALPNRTIVRISAETERGVGRDENWDEARLKLRKEHAAKIKPFVRDIKSVVASAKVSAKHERTSRNASGDEPAVMGALSHITVKLMGVQNVSKGLAFLFDAAADQDEYFKTVKLEQVELALGKIKKSARTVRAERGPAIGRPKTLVTPTRAVIKLSALTEGGFRRSDNKWEEATSWVKTNRNLEEEHEAKIKPLISGIKSGTASAKVRAKTESFYKSGDYMGDTGYRTADRIGKSTHITVKFNGVKNVSRGLAFLFSAASSNNVELNDVKLELRKIK